MGFACQGRRALGRAPTHLAWRFYLVCHSVQGYGADLCSLGNNVPYARCLNQRHQSIRDKNRGRREIVPETVHLPFAESHLIGGGLPVLCSSAHAPRRTALPSRLPLVVAAATARAPGSRGGVTALSVSGPGACSFSAWIFSRGWGCRKNGGRRALEEERVSASLPAFGDTARRKRVES